MSGPVDYVDRHVRGLKSGQRNVLMTVAKYSIGRGYCLLSQSAIGERVELHRTQVNRNMATLIEMKLIERQGRRWYLLGWVGHDRELELCEHRSCQAEVRSRWGRRRPAVFHGSGLIVPAASDDTTQGALAALDASGAVPGPVEKAIRRHLRAV